MIEEGDMTPEKLKYEILKVFSFRTLKAQETARREAVEYIRNTAKERGEWSKGYEESIETLTNNN